MSITTLIDKLASKGLKLLNNIEFLIIGIIILSSMVALYKYIFAIIILIFAFIYEDLSLSSIPEFMLYTIFGLFLIASAVLLIYSPLILNKIRTKTSERNETADDISSVYIDREPWLTTLICICEIIFLLIFMPSVTFAHVILIAFINMTIISAIFLAPITRPSGIKKYYCLSYGFLLPMWVSVVSVIAMA